MTAASRLQGSASKGFPDRTRSGSRRSAVLVALQIHDGFQNRLRLRQDGILEDRLICHEGIQRADALDRGVKFIEKLVGDARSDFGAVSPTEHVDRKSVVYGNAGHTR